MLTKEEVTFIFKDKFATACPSCHAHAGQPCLGLNGMTHVGRGTIEDRIDVLMNALEISNPIR